MQKKEAVIKYTYDKPLLYSLWLPQNNKCMYMSDKVKARLTVKQNLTELIRNRMSSIHSHFKLSLLQFNKV